jgi:hypothetical protein
MPFPWSDDDEQPIGTPGHDGFCLMYLFVFVGIGALFSSLIYKVLT